MPRTVTVSLPVSWASVAGIALLVGGLALAGAGIARLRTRLTPLPYPGEAAVLCDTGVDGLVRHPTYRDETLTTPTLSCGLVDLRTMTGITLPP